MSVPLKATLTLTALMAAQALMGLLAPEQYRDVERIKATWFGNDWLTLVAAVPLLLVSSLGARRGSLRAFLMWAGCVGYAVYNYAFYLLGAALNVFLPLYVVSVVLPAAILILTLGKLDVEAIGLRLRAAAPVRLIGGAFAAIGVGLGTVWIGVWAAYVFAGRPTPVDADAFQLVAALDLSLMVPALVSGGVLLWRRRPWGVVVAAIAGVQGTLYLAVLSINSFISIERGHAAWPGEMVIWPPLAAVTATMSVLLLWSVRSDNSTMR
jgi:hypothetical protein